MTTSRTCVIVAGAHFRGLLAFDQGARLDGDFSGEVSGSGHLEVGPSATVDATVSVDTLSVAGCVRGEVHARDKVVVLPGGRLEASIETPRLQVGDGGQVEGLITMGPPAMGLPRDR